MDKTPSKQNIELVKGGVASYVELVAGALTTMLNGGLKTFGQTPGVDAWVMALQHRGVRRDEIAPATAAFVSGECGREFPSAGEFINFIIQRRENWELREMLRESVRREDQLRESEIKARNLERYGTENPTQEQIEQRLEALGIKGRLDEQIEGMRGEA